MIPATRRGLNGAPPTVPAHPGWVSPLLTAFSARPYHRPRVPRTSAAPEGGAAALEAGGRTVAVLGSGLDHLYPAEHRGLAAEAAARGAVLSEFPLGTRPLPAHFPRRNRLLSALGLATLVVEAAEGSGTLSTVRFAVEQGRDVLCVPGSIFSEASALTNRLIGEGAKLVSGPEDVLEELVRTAALRGLRPGPGAHASEPAAPVDASEEERRVLEHLHGEPVHVDELARAVGAPWRT